MWMVSFFVSSLPCVSFLILLAYSFIIDLKKLIICRNDRLMIVIVVLTLAHAISPTGKINEFVFPYDKRKNLLHMSRPINLFILTLIEKIR